ncbi:CLUMA_CG000307, isoform A [Clunio marinus]|uniref:CLUMA_CG000307, isoform A n=1 Tax=Clunio marinus TaxID=568069 RepID=A0A1J1HEP5_9DIPT|nr:CLUMA_CG000307, isoform A [Clunio marinus]
MEKKEMKQTLSKKGGNKATFDRAQFFWHKAGNTMYWNNSKRLMITRQRYMERHKIISRRKECEYFCHAILLCG